jgi:DNA-binding GntR family transcriptional regulator
VHGRGSVATIAGRGALDAAETEDAGGASLCELIRQDIVEGRLAAGSRLKVADLALRYDTSTNPVREALQQLRGEGFVQFSHNRGARVRAVDADLIRNVYEIGTVIEPYLTRWFVGYVTDADIAELEAIRDEIEARGFGDARLYDVLDDRFHQLIYSRHYNLHAVELWSRHRDVLRAIGRRFPHSIARREAIRVEHRELVECIKNHDAEGAARVIARHVEGAGRHLIEHLRASSAAAGGGLNREGGAHRPQAAMRASMQGAASRRNGTRKHPLSGSK